MMLRTITAVPVGDSTANKSSLSRIGKLATGAVVCQRVLPTIVTKQSANGPFQCALQ
jgi:hypothetical protein